MCAANLLQTTATTTKKSPRTLILNYIIKKKTNTSIYK